MRNNRLDQIVKELRALGYSKVAKKIEAQVMPNKPNCDELWVSLNKQIDDMYNFSNTVCWKKSPSKKWCDQYWKALEFYYNKFIDTLENYKKNCSKHKNYLLADRLHGNFFAHYNRSESCLMKICPSKVELNSVAHSKVTKKIEAQSNFPSKRCDELILLIVGDSSRLIDGFIDKISQIREQACNGVVPKEQLEEWCNQMWAALQIRFEWYKVRDEFIKTCREHPQYGKIYEDWEPAFEREYQAAVRCLLQRCPFPKQGGGGGSW